MLAKCGREATRRAVREQVVSAAIVGVVVEVGMGMAELDGGLMEVR
jgi:hypothetical protein